MDRLFEIDAYRKGGEALAVLRGSLVLSRSQDVKTRLGTLLKPPVDTMHIYLGELEFLDSAGLGALVGLKMGARSIGVELDFLSPQMRVEEIFRVSKLDTIFRIIRGVEADVIRGMLMHSSFCLWRDSKDTHQSEFNTQADFTHVPKSQWTQVVGDDSECEPGSRMNELCSEAVAAIRKGEYDQAIGFYGQMLAIDRDNMSALNNLSVIYEKKPCWYALARESWTRVLELSEQRGDERHAKRARTHLESLDKIMS